MNPGKRRPGTNFEGCLQQIGIQFRVTCGAALHNSKPLVGSPRVASLRLDVLSTADGSVDLSWVTLSHSASALLLVYCYARIACLCILAHPTCLRESSLLALSPPQPEAKWSLSSILWADRQQVRLNMKSVGVLNTQDHLP